MYTIFFTTLSMLISSHNFDCKREIYYRFNSYIEESGKTHYEMFQQFDSDSNKCIDYDEMNTLLQKIRVSWGCRWVQYTIDYFDVLAKDNCIQWSEFKTVLRNTKD